MSIVGTQRIPGTRCLVWVTRASRALTGSLRMDWGVRPRASYVRQSPVRPSQQPTLKRHRGHWNVPWRHSIAAAQRGQGSTAGSGAVSAGGEAAIRRRYAARRTAVEACGCPVPPRDTHLHGPAALRAARLSALPAPRSGVAQRGLRYPVSTRANRGAPGFHPFLTDRGGDERIRGRGGAAGAAVAYLTKTGRQPTSAQDAALPRCSEMSRDGYADR